MKVRAVIQSANLILALSGEAAVAYDVPASPAGRYCGELVSGGASRPVETVIAVEPDGRISGSYKFQEGDRIVSGLIAEVNISLDLTKKLLWRDEYGFGKLRVTFSGDYSGFQGAWGIGSSKESLSWNGKRCGIPIA